MKTKKGFVYVVPLAIITIAIISAIVYLNISKSKNENVEVPQNELTFEETKDLPVLPPFVKISLVENNVKLAWNGTGDDTLKYYLINRRVKNTDTWEEIAKVDLIERNKGEYSYTDTLPEPINAYEYQVWAVNQFDNFGKSDSVFTK